MALALSDTRNVGKPEGNVKGRGTRPRRAVDLQGRAHLVIVPVWNCGVQMCAVVTTPGRRGSVPACGRDLS